MSNSPGGGDCADVVVIDCIEFNERFRCGDVATENAFLAMDLDYRGHPAFSAYLVSDLKSIRDFGALAGWDTDFIGPVPHDAQKTIEMQYNAIAAKPDAHGPSATRISTCRATSCVSLNPRPVSRIRTGWELTGPKAVAIFSAFR